MLKPATLANVSNRLTGKEYDLVAFDPRYVLVAGGQDRFRIHTNNTSGTVNTIPFTCYNDSLEASDYLNGQQMAGNSSNVAVGHLWARGTIDSRSCAANARKTGELIGTAFTARDLMSVAEALEEDGMLRYWGKLVWPDYGETPKH